MKTTPPAALPAPFSYPPIPDGQRGGFVTGFLPDYQNGDWVCVEDFCGGSSHGAPVKRSMSARFGRRPAASPRSAGSG